MTQTRPIDGRYLFVWFGVWLLATVPTQLPECYERSVGNAPIGHASVFGEWMQLAGSRLLLELPCGLIWGALSWLLQWAAFALWNQSSAPGFVRKEAVKWLWPNLAPVVLVASVEAVLLGLPLASMNSGWVNFSLCTEDSPPVTITDRSIMIESAGILLAFPVSCLVAGYFAVAGRKPSAINAPADQNDAWPPPPRPST